MQATDRILVTGGAGFIGSALVWELNRRGLENIIICDLLASDDKWRNLVPLRFCDYIDGGELVARLPLLSEVKWVFHLGACSATTERNASYLMANNTQFSCELAAWAMAGRRRFVYASSAATYGDGSHGMDDGQAGLERLRPLNMYGYSKHLFDLWAQRRGWLKEIVGLKYFNIFGPNENHKGTMRSVVAKAYEQIKQRGWVELFQSEHPDYPDGGQMRDFLYVKDAVAMTLHLAETLGAKGIYNIGSGRAATWLELVRPIFAAMKCDEDIRFVPLPEALRGTYQYYTKATIERLRQTGWNHEPRPLADAVFDYVTNYLMPDARLGDEPS